MHKRRPYMINLRKSELIVIERSSFTTTSPITWPNEIKCNVCQIFTFNYLISICRSFKLQRYLKKIFTVPLLHYLLTCWSSLKKYAVSARAQRLLNDSFSIQVYESPQHFNSGSFGLNFFKPGLSVPFLCKQNMYNQIRQFPYWESAINIEWTPHVLLYHKQAYYLRYKQHTLTSNEKIICCSILDNVGGLSEIRSLAGSQA